MISQLLLKFGRAPNSPAQPIDLVPITGPNNSGKSKILSEIEYFCSTGQRNSSDLLLERMAFSGLTRDAALLAIEQIKSEPTLGEPVAVDHVIIASRHGRQQYPYSQLISFLESPSANVAAFCQWFLRHSTLKLDGSSRIGLVNIQPAGDLQQPAHTSFQVLFRNDAKRTEVRRIVNEAFGSYFVIDPTSLGNLRIRLSERPPADGREERGIHAEAVAFHAAAQPIESASDGVKAFTGIITELIAGDPRVLLIDEPEAFLHPPLAFKLGYEVARAAASVPQKRVLPPLIVLLL